MADFTEYAAPCQDWLTFVQDGRLPAPPTGSTPAERRDNFNAARAAAQRDFYGPPPDVDIQPLTIPTADGAGIAARLYRPRTPSALLPIYVHLHSGGWHFGSLDTEEPFCMHVCAATRPSVAVLNVCYRHTPEHIFPTQQDDAQAAVDFLFSPKQAALYGLDTSRIVVGGTSAGAALALSCAVREIERLDLVTASHRRIKGLLLTCPPTVHPDHFPFQSMRSRDAQSYTQCADDVLLGYTTLILFWDMFLPRDDDARLAATMANEISPLVAPDRLFDPQHWPPTAMHVAGADVLRDEALLLAERLQRAGVPTRLRTYSGCPHAFNMLPELPQSQQWRESVIEELAWLFGD